PPRAHGFPLRRRFSHRVAGGVRAARPRRDARRRTALHAHRRGLRAVVARRCDRRRVGARPAGVPELPRRHLGPTVRGRAPETRREIVAAALTSIREIERALSSLRAEPGAETPYQRTSVMTHTAWVPPAGHVRGGPAGRSPSGTAVLSPQPAQGEGLDGEVEVDGYPAGEGRQICTETIRIRLKGPRATAPASVIQPLLLPDLPAFLRWRGLPPYGAQEFEQLIDVVDRLIVDSTEWPDLPESYRGLEQIFDRVAVSDIAWARTGRWRPMLASLWPEISGVQRIRVKGTTAQANLIAGWLRSRLKHPVELGHEPSDRLVGV